MVKKKNDDLIKRGASGWLSRARARERKNEEAVFPPLFLGERDLSESLNL